MLSARTFKALAAAALVSLATVPVLGAQAAWGATQTVETYDEYANGGVGTPVATLSTHFTLSGITYTTDSSTNSYVYTSDEDAPLSTGPSDGVLCINWDGWEPMTEVVMSLADGDPMTVSSFDFDSGDAEGTIYLIPDGQTAKELQLSGSQLSGVVNLSSNPNFRGVLSLEILDVGDLYPFSPTLNNFTYTHLNSPPHLSASGGSASFVEGDDTTSTPVAVDSGITLTDGDSTTAASATVSITNNFQSGQDVLAFANTNSATYGNISASYVAGTGVLTLSSAGDTATIAQWQAALEAVTYTDTATPPTTGARTVSFNLNDGLGDAGSSNTVTRQVTVADTDQTPVVTTTGGTTSYVGGTSAVTVDSGVAVSDSDNTTQASATVSLSSGFSSGDLLGFVNDGTTMGNIAGSYNSATGVLTLTSSGATATDAQWASALSAVSFSSTSTTYGDRVISFAVNDGTKTSNAATKTLDVTNPSPVIATDGGAASFVAGDNVTSTPVVVDPGLSLTDPGSSTAASATVALTGNFHSGQDVLGFTNTNLATYGNISASYVAGTGVLTLTSAGSSATLAQWDAALQEVTYTDTAITPNDATRTVSFTIVDASSNSSNTATRNVTVADTDQTPVVTTTGGTTNYVGGTSAVTIDNGVTVTDSDNTTQSSGTVAITSGFSSGDVLGFTYDASTMGNIAGSYDPATGVLTLTSSGATATDAQWASALSAVSFSSTSTTYGDRVISFAVNDGSENSSQASDSVDELAPPSLTTSAGSASFIAGDNMTSTPVTVDSAITLADPGSPRAASATVAVTGNFHSGQDELAFTNDGSTMGNIAGSYNSATGVLTLTSPGASATLAQWQAALEEVTYTDTAITPNNATRTISFTVVDASSDSSNTASRNVTVADTDQTPVVTTTGGTTAFVAPYNGNPSPTPLDPGITVSDRDNSTLASATVSLTTGFQAGQDVLSFANNGSTMGNIAGSYNSTTGVLTLTSSGATATLAQWQSALRSVSYMDNASNPDTTVRTISFVVSDGTENSTASYMNVSVSRAPAPALTSTSTALRSSANPGAIGTAISYTATITPLPGGGSVTFTDQGSPITGCYELNLDATSGTAVCQVSYGAHGSHVIVAEYSGYDLLAPSMSMTITENIAAPSTGPAPTGPGKGGPQPTTGCGSFSSSLDESFVCQVYVEALNRAPSPNEAAAWTTLLRRGTSREQVAYDILVSPQYRRDVVDDYYQVYLGRPADSAALASWSKKLASSNGDKTVLADILGSDEYYDRSGGSPAAFISCLYRDLFDRPADHAGLALWERKLSSGTSRTAIALALLSSTEYRRHFVTSEHALLSKGRLTSRDLSAWVAQLGKGGSYETVIAEIIASA